MKAIFLVLFSGLLFNTVFASDEVTDIKQQIITLAQSYEGLGDPDFSKQKSLDILVQKLLKTAPQPAVSERLNYLYGTWKQVWGPYQYRNSDRGVDPNISPDEIYQTIFESGYYYNTSPIFTDGDKSQERIGLLRGEFVLSKNEPNSLNIQFVCYPGLSQRPVGLNLWELPELAESGVLKNTISIVPTFIIKWFFSKGTLREVYTDSDLRIAYGQDQKNVKNEFIYIMTKIK